MINNKCSVVSVLISEETVSKELFPLEEVFFGEVKQTHCVLLCSLIMGMVVSWRYVSSPYNV